MSTATIDQDIDTELEQPRRRRRGLLWLTLGAVVLAGAGSSYWFLLRDPGAEPSSEPTGPVATTEVTRAAISDTENWGGSLGHGSPFVVTTAGQGTVTRVAAQESQITRGSELYRLNEKPVMALIGAIPMYRDLAEGDVGADVEQLEANLTALGYDGFDVDDEFTSYTAAAVEEWQEDLGVDETGVVAVSDVVFMPAGGRVDTVHAAIGDAVSPGADVLDITGSEQVAALEVEVADRDLVAVGTAVTVRLPGGTEAAGTVTAAAVVEASSDDDGGTGGDDDSAGSEDAVTEVEVTLTEPVDEALLGSPVDVVVAVNERADVLVVPVTALLALAEGGFGLEVVADDGTTSIVAVEAGLFADGQVEVGGEGIDEGTVVGVAGR